MRPRVSTKIAKLSVMIPLLIILLLWGKRTPCLSISHRASKTRSLSAKYVFQRKLLSSCRSICDRQLSSTVKIINDYKCSPKDHITVSQGGHLEIQYGVKLNLNGAIVKVASLSTVFTGRGEVLGLRSARPEWFGERDDPTTLPKAINSLLPGGRLLLGIGRYNSSVYDGAHPLSFGINFEGTRYPTPNRTLALMQSGTILYPYLNIDASNVTLRNLGCDGGTATVSSANDCIHIKSYRGPEILRHFLLVEDVSCLGFSVSAPFHCFKSEGINNVKIRGLHTWRSTHGWVVKGDRVVVQDTEGHGHASECGVVKSNVYAPTKNVNIRDVKCYTELSGDTQATLLIHAQTTALSQVKVAHLRGNGTLYGVHIYGESLANQISEVTVTDAVFVGPDPLMQNSIGLIVDGYASNIYFGGINLSKFNTAVM